TRAPPSRLMRCSCESAFGALSFLSPPRTPSRLRLRWARFRLAERATGAGHPHDGVPVARRGGRPLGPGGAPAPDAPHRGPSRDGARAVLAAEEHPGDVP